MKRIAVLVVLAMLAFAGVASAVTFPATDCLTVSADKNGLVTATGKTADVRNLVRAIIFCPDKYKGGCWDNYPIKTNSDGSVTATFQMDMERVRSNQRSFNYKSNGHWLLVPHSLVKVGSNLILELSAPSEDSEDGRGGAHFTFIGDNPNYQPLVPIYSGGEACGAGARMPVRVSKPAPVAKPSVSYRKRADGSICQEPCIEEIKQNTRVIKEDVKVIKESVGVPEKDDPVDEKTVQQKARKTLKSVGQSKSGRSLHDKVGESRKSGTTLMGLAEENNAMLKQLTHNGKPPELFDKTCLECHKGPGNKGIDQFLQNMQNQKK